MRLCIILYVLESLCRTNCNAANVRKFPDGFRFGTGTSSHQVEGAWNLDGKSENIWDHLAHSVPSPVKDGSTADIANDSYHQYKRDVEMMRDIGVDFHRFSLSWTRIMPTSFPNEINKHGVQYYNNLINEMLKYNIEPVITLHHMDLPQNLQVLGGWANPQIIDWYTDFARVAFQLFGDRVKFWITINEPEFVCKYWYNIVPVNNASGIVEYVCAKNALLAHAKAYHVYDKEFRPTQGGSIFISLNAWWFEPESQEHVTAAEDAFTMGLDAYAHPIFSEKGDFPTTMKERIAAKSKSQGFFRSRLPEFTPEEVDYVRGTSDYFGLNHYSSRRVYRNESVVGHYKAPSYLDDLDVGLISYNASIPGPMIKSVPWGFYKLLTKIRETYNNKPVYITENGFATFGGLNDNDRVAYFRDYLNAMLDAIAEGSDVRAYTAWSLMDNFEWSKGYTQRFGLYEVDYSSPNRTRTPRKSAFFYKEIMRTRSLDPNYEPQTTVMSIDEGH